MRTSKYILDIVAQSESTMTVKHVKYGQHTIDIIPSEEFYSFTDNSTGTLHTFKISVTSPILFKNLQMLHNDSQECGVIVYEAKVNGISVNQQIERVKQESKNQAVCNIELNKIPFTPISLQTGDLLVLRFSVEWCNFKSFNTDFKNMVSKANINRK
jgi:hypothetical protein